MKGERFFASSSASIGTLNAGPPTSTSARENAGAWPQLSKMRPQYDVKTLKGNERAADGWTAITLSNTDGLCGAAESSAAAAVVKSKSNITNN